MNRMLCSLIGLTTLAFVVSAGAADGLSQTLQVGLLEEEANQNLPAAIAAYQKVLELHEGQRQLAASALFRLGECHRKLGQTNEAIAQYERLLREFPDQAVLANLSRQNLTGLGAPPPLTVPALLSDPARREQARLLEEEIKLSEQEVETLEKMVEAGREPLMSLTAAKRRLLALQRQLVPYQDLPGEAPVVTDDEEREVQRIKTLIANSPDLINAPGMDGYTPLIAAARDGRLVVARFLLDHGAEVNGAARRRPNLPNLPNVLPVSLEGQTPLHAAAERGHLAMAELLIERGADVNAKKGDGSSPLHVAVSRGYLALCRLLLDAQAPVNALDDGNETPLHLAVKQAQADLVGMLLEKGADPNLVSQSPTKRPTPDPQDIPYNAGTALHLAYDKPEITGLLLQSGAKPDILNEAGHAPLHYAAAWGMDAVANRLVEGGATVDILVSEGNWHSGWSPLDYAMVRGKEESMVKLLLEAGADPNQTMPVWERCQRQTPLHVAALEGNTRKLQTLLAFHSDPNVTNDCGQTPLVLAMSRKEGGFRTTNVLALLRHGANPDGGVLTDHYPLHYAVYRSDLEAAQALLEQSANPNVRELKNGFTPLHALVFHWRQTQQPNIPSPANPDRPLNEIPLALARLLIEHGADVNALTKHGQTPLRILGVPPEPDDVTLRALADLLREHGARVAPEELPPDPDTIRAWRPGQLEGIALFTRSSNYVNHFTLMDVLLQGYPLSSLPTVNTVNRSTFQQRLAGILQSAPLKDIPFPDLTQLVVRRLQPDGSYMHERVAFVDPQWPNALPCERDITLQFGDVLVIPERPHALSDKNTGIPPEQIELIEACRYGQVSLVVQDKTIELPIRSVLDRYLSRLLHGKQAQAALLSTSDLKRVKVTRKSPDGPKIFEVNAEEQPPQHEDLLLELGDVIEVPERTL